MRFWWVNQNQTYETEVPGGFMWSPKTRVDGARNQFYENMRHVSPGDIVFSFCGTRIKAIGIAVGPAETSTKPDFGGAGGSWSSEGWLVPVEFRELQTRIRPRDHIDAIRPLLPAKYAPLQSTTGSGLQSVYLAEVPGLMAALLAELIGEEYTRVVGALQDETEGDVTYVEEQQEAAIAGRTDIGATEKQQLVKARRGQGVFKANVRLNEQACRVTGVSDPLHLRASHIKPWKDSNDAEKLDGCNGLLLAPHIDHLFDRGLMSFTNEGNVLVSGRLDPSVLLSWGIEMPLNVGTFNVRQVEFLNYHRSQVFKL
jgi:putative restriction endonuclease